MLGHGVARGIFSNEAGMGTTPMAHAAARSDDVMVDAILDGRPGTPMPPWRRFINEPEAAWLVQRLRPWATPTTPLADLATSWSTIRRVLAGNEAA